MRSFTFTIPGQPKGKMRPKVTMQGGFAHAYTPKETTSYSGITKSTAITVMRWYLIFLNISTVSITIS